MFGSWIKPMPAAEPVSLAPVAKPQQEQPPESLGAAIRALGMQHEGMRLRFEGLIDAAKIFKSTSSDLEGLLADFSEISASYQQKTALVDDLKHKLEMAFTQAQEYNEAAGALQSKNLSLQTQVEALSAQSASVERQKLALEEQLRTAQEQLSDALLNNRNYEYSLAESRARVISLGDELERLTQKLKDNERSIQEISEDRRTVRERLAVETEERSRLAKAHEELLVASSQQKRALAETSSQLEKIKAQFIELDAQHRAAAADAAQLRGALETSEARREESEAAGLSKVEALESRLKLTEKLLAKSREESRRVADLQLEYDETKRRLAQALASNKDIRVELDNALRQVSQFERAKVVVMERANDLVGQLREKQTLNEQAAERIRLQQELIAQTELKYQSEIEKLNERIAAMADEIAKERSDKAYIEGALQIARRDRTQLQNAILELSNGNGQKAGPSLAPVVERAEADLQELQASLRSAQGPAENIHTFGQPQQAKM